MLVSLLFFIRLRQWDKLTNTFEQKNCIEKHIQTLSIGPWNQGIITPFILKILYVLLFNFDFDFHLLH